MKGSLFDGLTCIETLFKINLRKFFQGNYDKNQTENQGAFRKNGVMKIENYFENK